MRLEPNQAPYEGGWVFSSTGDIIRKPVLPLKVATFRRLGLAGRKLLDSAVSRGVFAALFPSDCRLCGIPLTNISRLPVCQNCLLAMSPISIATCDFCGDSLATTLAESSEQLCAECRLARPHFVKAKAYGAYDNELRDLIHLLKYEQVTPAAAVLGRMLAEAVEKLEIGTDRILAVPVPLHRSKRRQRGFNQAALILRAAMKRNGFPPGYLATDVLERTRPTLSQIGLTGPQRAENIRGAFRVKHLNKVAGRQVLLVDDVLTTGTTANECARVLLKAGAGKVWVATVARTLKEHAAGFEKLASMNATISSAQNARVAKAS